MTARKIANRSNVQGSLRCEHIIQIYSRCVPENFPSPQVWPPTQGLHSSPDSLIPPYTSVENPPCMNAFHKASWPGFASLSKDDGYRYLLCEYWRSTPVRYSI